MDNQYNTFVSDWVSSFATTKIIDKAPEKYADLKWSLRDATTNVNIFIDGNVKSLSAYALTSNIGTFKDLSIMIN